MGAPLAVSPESLLLLKLAKAVKELKARQPEKGDAGREPTADEIFTAVSLWMEFHREEVRGEPGKTPKAIPGPSGVGIDDLDVEDGELVVALTDGRKKRFKLPMAKDRRHSTAYLGAGGMASSNPVVSGNASAGWAQYADTDYTSESPFSANDGVEVALPNNAGTGITDFLPTGVAALYDPILQRITPKAIGDYQTITVRFKARASVASSYLDFGIDIGGSQGVIFRETKVFAKGADVEHSFAFVVPGYSLNSFVTNGGQVKVTPGGGDVELYGIEYQIVRHYEK